MFEWEEIIFWDRGGREYDWKIPFPILGNGNTSGTFLSQFSGTGMQVKNSFPNFREQECEWKIPFPNFGNGNGVLVFLGMTREITRNDWEMTVK